MELSNPGTDSGGRQTGGPTGRPCCVTEPEAVPGLMPVPGDGSGREPGGCREWTGGWRATARTEMAD